MFFQISPVIHKKSKPVEPKKTENEESKVELLSLAPFTSNPKIVFDDVPIGVAHTRRLLVKNPTGSDIHLFVKKSVPEELNLALSWTEATINRGTETMLEMVWQPTEKEACRHSFTLSDGKRINRDVAVTFRTVSPKKPKSTGTKKKTNISKSPIKLPLTRKTASPTKYLKPQRKSPRKYPSPKRKSPVKNLPSPQKSTNQHRYLRENLKEEQTYVYHQMGAWSHEMHQENKENVSPAFQRNASGFFMSPTNATFSMENNDTRNTYVLEPMAERRETFTLRVANYCDQNKSVISKSRYFENTESTFTLGSVENSPNFRDSLERPDRVSTPLLPQNNHQGGDGTPTLESLLNRREYMEKFKSTPDFGDKLKSLDNFTFSPAVSSRGLFPPSVTNREVFSPTVSNLGVFSPAVFSTNIKNLKNPFSMADSTPRLATHLFSPNIHLNVSNESCNEVNISSNTYTKENLSWNNVSSETYVKNASFEDVEQLKVPFQAPFPVLQKTSDVGFTNTETFKNSADFRWQQQNLSAIAEESGVFSECSLRNGIKRKSSSFSIYPTKREKMSPERKKDWSKKGGAAFRIAKSTTGISLEKLQKSSPKSTLQPISAIKETTVKSVIIQNPFLYSNLIDPFMGCQVYSNDEWLDAQELRFKKWINMLLTPPDELNSKNEVDIAKIWQQCKKKEVPEAPTKEVLSLNFHTSTKLDALRREAQNLFRSKEMSSVLQKVCIVVETGKLSIREDKDIYLNLKLKSDLMALLFSYNPLWLRIGLETIYNEIIPLKSNSDTHGLANFLLERFFKDPYLVKKHKTLYSPKYSSDLKKFLLKKFLILVYFLDKAKNGKLIPHDPCLFCNNSAQKESKLMLISFARDTLAAIGDVTKYLKCLGYVVTHVQSYIHEFNYAVKNLGVDLRDGVRLTKIMEIIQMRNDLIDKLRVPAISRLQKVHNMQIVFKSLAESGYEIQYDICAKDIVDGHREKTLSFLWQIIYKFDAPLMVTSATTLQRWFRSLPVMLKRRQLQKLYQKRENAARKIQGWYRRQKLAKLYVSHANIVRRMVENRKQNLAATKIQSFLKMVICKKRYNAQLKIIIKLQCYARGWLIRHNYRHRIIAVKLIQKIYRGYSCKKRYLDLRKATIVIQRRFRAKREMRKVRSEFEELRKVVMIVQQKFRGNREASKSRKEFLKIKNAVVKIQSAYRMRKCHKRFLEVKKAAVVLQERYRARRSMIAARNKYFLLQKYVLRIQRQFRANLIMKECRKKYVEKRTAVIKIQSFYKMYSCRRRFLDVRSATRVLQERYRARKSMIEARCEYLLLQQSVLCIQTRYRAILKMKECRKKYVEARSAVYRIQSFYRMYKCRKRFLEVSRATSLLQKRYRANKLMKEARSNYLTLKKSVLLVQRKYRATRLGSKAKQEYLRTRNAIVTIQSCFRMFVVRREFLELKNAATVLQTRFTAQRLMREQRSSYQKLRNAAIVFQQRWRARKLYFDANKRYLEVKRATVIIQQIFRAKKQMQVHRERYVEVRTATVKIQVWFRSVLLVKTERKRFLEIKKSVLIVEKRYVALKLMRQEHTKYQNFKKAAIIIQQFYKATTKMRIEKKAYLDLKRATLVFQRRFRAQNAMKKHKLRFGKLKKATQLVQAKFRANNAMKLQRSYFLKQKNAAVKIQQWYRATIKMRQCRNYYKKLQVAVSSVEMRFKAQKEMRLQRSYYLNLRRSCLLIQQKYRSILAARKCRKEFVELRTAVIIIQRRFRAIKEGRIVKKEYEQLRSATIVMQRRYRAQQAMQQARATWAAIKIATVCIQSRYRATKVRGEYKRVKNAVLVIQRRYRAQKLMIIEQRSFQKYCQTVIFVQQKFRAKLLSKQRRSEYLMLKTSVVTVQQRFRANILMKKQKDEFTKLRDATIMIQRKYRATVLTRIARKEFIAIRSAAIVIQQRYRAIVGMWEQSSYYRVLIMNVKVIQRRFRANRLAKIERANYLKLRKAAITIQWRFRARNSMVLQMERYSRLKWAALVFQQRYRAQLVMKREMSKFRALKHATFVIQRRFRASVLSVIMRKWFLKLKNSVRVIQTHFRAYLAMKKERGRFLEVYRATVMMQRFGRGYLARKKYLPLLSAEAVEARRVSRVQNAAAVIIQASWRGYAVRKSNIDVQEAIKKRRKERGNELVNPIHGTTTLAQRCEMAMLCMTSENSSLLMVIRALKDLDFITRHCRDSCIRLSHILPSLLYTIISSAARSLPEMDACNTAAFILINFCKYPRTRTNSWDAAYVDAVVNVMLHWCDKEAPLFATLCTLLWLFGHEEPWKQVILGLPNINQRFHKIQSLVLRKQNMVLKSKKEISSSVFGRVMNMKWPTRNANWGLDYDRPNTFTNAVFGFSSLMNILEII